MKIRTLDDLDVRGKRVLVRLDLNSDVRNGKIEPSERLRAPIVTLKELRNKKARVVIISHQGRLGSNDFISLGQHAKYLNKFIKIKFINDIRGKKVIKAIKNMKDGDIILLDNIRKDKEEMNKSSRLVKELAPLFSYYVNDAFSVSHREQASIVGFPKVLTSAIGRVFERELENISQIHASNSLLVLGGSKPDDFAPLLENTRNRILASGLFGVVCRMSQGYNFGKENEILKEYKTMFPLIRKNKNRIVMPIDFGVNVSGERKDLLLKDFPSNYEIIDLGRKTIEEFSEEINKHSQILMKGLAGLCGKSSFSIGTESLLKTIAKNKGFSVVSGGHTLTMIEKLKLKKKFGYVSLSGGALIHYLAYKTLPGIEAIKNSPKDYYGDE